jgi:soluble lytic murein transglycosylase
MKAKARWESLAREKKIPVAKIAPEALLNRALHFYQAHSYETALGEMSQIEGYPRQSYPAQYAGEPWVDDLYFHRGMCHFRLKQYPRAVEVFDLVLSHSRVESMAEKSLFWLFQALIRSGRKKEALKAGSLLQASYPRSSWLPQALHLQAAVYEDMGETAQAFSLYGEVAEKFPQSPFRFPALWNAGWLRYREKGYSTASQTWDRLKELDPHSRWTEKAMYWLGKSSEKMGQAREAEEMYGQLQRNFPTSYYSQLASSRGRALLSSKGSFPALQDPTLSPLGEVNTNSSGSRGSHIEKGRNLVRLFLLPLAVEELEAAEGVGASRDEIWMEISRLYREAEEYYRSNLLVRRKFTLKPLSRLSTEREKTLYRLAYPLGNPSLIHRYAQIQNLDPSLLCAVILEESRFHSQAVSPAGAKGWMQVLPRTGTQIARELKIPRFSEDQLFDPEMNVRLGSWYLSKLLEEFGGKVHLALAAYNAGPHAVRKWMANAPSSTEDEFVENIPYWETRNYVIRVISSAQVYRTLYRPPEKPVQP